MIKSSREPNNKFENTVIRIEGPSQKSSERGLSIGTLILPLLLSRLDTFLPHVIFTASIGTSFLWKIQAARAASALVFSKTFEKCPT
jgi:hypothetical protein